MENQYSEIYISNLHLNVDNYHNVEDYIFDFTNLDIQRIYWSLNELQEHILEIEVHNYCVRVVVDSSVLENLKKRLRRNGILKKHCSFEEYLNLQLSESRILNFSDFSKLRNLNLTFTIDFWNSWQERYCQEEEVQY